MPDIKRVAATKPKLILAIGATAAQGAKDMVEDIPVVFFVVLLRSLRHV